MQPATAVHDPRHARAGGHQVSIWSDVALADETPGSAYRIERRSGLSYEGFAQDHVRTSRPVVITDAATNWPALSKWTPIFFKERFGTAEMDVEGETQPLDAFIDDMMASRFDRPGRNASSIAMRQQFPSLLEDIGAHEYWFPERVDRRFVKASLSKHGLPHGARLDVTLGGAGSVLPEPQRRARRTAAFVVQIHGRQEWILSRYGRVVRFFVGPGDMVYVPPGWWHTARTLTPSIALVLTMARGPTWWVAAKAVCAWVLGALSKMPTPPQPAARAKSM